METDRLIVKAEHDRVERRHFARRIDEVSSNHNDKTIIIPFNPWRFQEEATLLRAFFFDVAKKLDASLTTRGEKLSSIASDYAEVLTIIPGYGTAATGFVKNWTRKRAEVDVNAL